MLLSLYALESPVIDTGPYFFSAFTKANVRVKIGTPVFVYSGYDVTIDCKIISGTPPINITWTRDRSIDLTRDNASTITLTAVMYYVVFSCRAENYKGFDSAQTVIRVAYGKYVLYTHV